MPASTGSGAMPPTPAVRARQVAGVPSYEMWYDQLFPGFRDCAFVSGSLPAPHGTSLIGMVRYKELGFAVPEHLYIYAVKSRCGAVTYLPVFAFSAGDDLGQERLVRGVAGVVLYGLAGQRRASLKVSFSVRWLQLGQVDVDLGFGRRVGRP